MGQIGGKVERGPARAVGGGEILVCVAAQRAQALDVACTGGGTCDRLCRHGDAGSKSAGAVLGSPCCPQSKRTNSTQGAGGTAADGRSVHSGRAKLTESNQRDRGRLLLGCRGRAGAGRQFGCHQLW